MKTVTMVRRPEGTKVTVDLERCNVSTVMTSPTKTVYLVIDRITQEMYFAEREVLV